MRAQRYRSYALECLRFAREMSEPSSRAVLLDMALPERVAELTAANPAKRFGIARKGRIEEGFEAFPLDPGDNPGHQLYEAKPDAVFLIDTGLNTLWSGNWIRQRG